MIDKDDPSGTPFYDDRRKTTYGALFAENVFRFEYFHLVTSARFDREELSSAESLAPHPALVNASYTKSVPLFGIGIGNDFGQGNESYLNVSQGFRPLRYLDIASPFSNFSTTNNPDPTLSENLADRHIRACFCSVAWWSPPTIGPSTPAARMIFSRLVDPLLLFAPEWTGSQDRSATMLVPGRSRTAK